MRIFRKLFLHSFKHYMIALGSLVGLVMIIMWINKFNLSRFPSAFATSGLILTFVGLLLLLSHLGAFDTLGYAFTTFKTRSRRPYKDLVEYTEVKNSARKVKEYFFVPYILVGLVFFVIGLVNWIFVKPLPKLEQPTNITIVEVVDNKLEITWDKNEQAINGYHIEIKEYSESSDEEPSNIYHYDEKVAQPNTDKVTLTISVPDTNKKYIIYIICLATEDANSSDKAQSIYDPE